MKKILNLLFTVCAFSLLTFSYANASSDDDAPETAGVGQQEDESVDCIAINGTQSEDAPAESGSAEEGPSGVSTDR